MEIEPMLTNPIVSKYIAFRSFLRNSNPDSVSPSHTRNGARGMDRNDWAAAAAAAWEWENFTPFSPSWWIICIYLSITICSLAIVCTVPLPEITHYLPSTISRMEIPPKASSRQHFAYTKNNKPQRKVPLNANGGLIGKEFI